MKNLPQKISLVAQTASVLKDEIRAGRWSKDLPGEHELCGLLHVGRVTLRRALRQLEREGWVRTSQGKRRRIVHRRSLAAPARSDRVMLLTPVPWQGLPPQIVFWIDGLRGHLSEAGYHLDVRENRACYTGRPEGALESLAKRSSVAGWVLSQSTARMQRWFAQRALPCVIAGSRYEGVSLPSVDRDYWAISRHAVGAFLARGHRRLALLNPLPVLAGDRESEGGFKEGLQTHAGDAGGCIIYHNGTVGDICAKLELLLKRRQPPTGLLVARAHHVLSVMSYLLARGLRFPRDAALISRDDNAFLESMLPSVARYAHSPIILARTISSVVLTMVRGGAEPKDHRIMPRFIPGQSLGEVAAGARGMA
jgi:DNA-binding LacI/PurR family transcriptional regulator